MAADLEESAPQKVTAFVRDAVARLKAAPRFFNQAEWEALASYDGPIVSGDPEGRILDDLEADDNE